MEKAYSGRLVKFGLTYFIILFFLPFLNSSYIYAGQTVGIARDAENYRTKGYEAQQLGDINTAIEWYQKAASISPAYASPHNDLGILFETKGWLDKAEAEYKKALAIDPAYKEVHTNLALLYERKGELEKAAFHWMRRYKLGSMDDPWTEEAKSRLEKLGLLSKEEKPVQKITPKAVIKKEASRSVKETKKPLDKKPIEKKSKSSPKAKKDSGWTKVGAKKNNKQVKTSKADKSLSAELQESLRLAEERLKKEKAGKQNTAAAKRKTEAKAVIAPDNGAGIAYNKAKDYRNKGEYAKALDVIRLAKQDSAGNKSLLELEEEIKFKMKEGRIEDYYKEGMIRYRQKDFAGARKEFEAILSILPE